MNPQVSVVTLNFNQGHYLTEALDSVRAQAGVEWEHIIVDPGSTDGSQSIYAGLRDDPRYVIIEKSDSGPGEGLNNGFRAARGQYFYYLNADDRVLPGAFEQAVRRLGDIATTECVIAGHGYLIDAQGDRVRPIYSQWRSPRDYAMGASVALQQSTFFSRSAYLSAGGFNEENRICWDGELVVDMALAGAEVRQVPDFLGEFRIHAEGITGSGLHAHELSVEHARIFEKVLHRPSRLRDRLEAGVRRVASLVSDPAHASARVFYRVQGKHTRGLSGA